MSFVKICRDLFTDGYKIVGLAAPLASLAFTIAKALGVDFLRLSQISYGWAFAPLFAWVLTAYIRRWFLIDEYACSLEITGIDSDQLKHTNNTGEQVVGGSFQFILKLRNSYSKPIEFRPIGISIGGAEVPSEGKSSTSISGSGERTFTLPGVPVTKDFFSNYMDVPFAVEFVYGPVGSGGTRKMRKEFLFRHFPNGAGASVGIQRESDEPYNPRT